MKKSLYYIILFMIFLPLSLSAQDSTSAENKVIRPDSLARSMQQWIDNANRIESLLKQNAIYLQSLENNGKDPDTHWLDEADVLMERYKSEDRTNLAVDSLMLTFDTKYRLYSQEIQRQKKEMKKFRNSRITMSLGGGGFITFQEPGILFHYYYEHYNALGKLDSRFDTSGYYLRNYTGFSFGGSLSWLMKENISIEFNYMYASIHLRYSQNDYLRITSSWPVGSNPKVFLMTAQSITFIGNYFMEMTQRFKVISGLGFTFTRNDIDLDNKYSASSQENDEIQVWTTVPCYSDYWEIMMRIGSEFSLNNASTLTLQFLCDGRIPLSSSFQDLPISLQPYFRLVWHL
jgi:Skp family chaperone for outer membrane proteins